MDFYKKMLNPKCEPIRYYSGAIDNVIKMEEDKDLVEQEYVEDDEMDENYADEFRRIESERYAASVESTAINTGGMSDISTINDLTEDKPDVQMYNNYNFSVSKRSQTLLIDKYKDDILSLIKTNMVIVIHGPTGCGKSTQVPQFILDDCVKMKQPCNIVVTQPRKIAAISLSRRVSEERCWSYGSVCGYQIGLEKEISPQTLITYVTTGVLLKKIITSKTLLEYTHIIIDEVHERSQDMDFLLIIVRKFLHMNSPNVKIILMSATFDTQKFSHYFRSYFQSQEHRAPTVYVDEDNEKRFNVQEYFLDSLSQIGEIPNFEQMVDSPKLHPDLTDILIVLLQAFDRLEKKNDSTNQLMDIGHVLIFLPGIMQIEEVFSKLREANNDSNHVKWTIIPLHSSISIEEQKKAFQLPPDGHRKIILSTNIAESSITVPDIGYVVDFCLTKALAVDPQTNYHRLQLIWASKSNCIQRAGRVGRVRDGRVYRMVPKRFYMNHMSESLEPEMLRAPLETTILYSKMIGLPEPPHAILALAIDPPEIKNIHYSIKLLKETGGLRTTCNGVPIKSDGDLTFLGHIMASLPLDIKLSKLIVLGYMFNCLEDCIIMAAGCTLSNIFTYPFMAALKMYTSRLLWANNSQSDLIALLHLYKVWSRHKAANVFGNIQAESRWCKQHFVSLRALREWQYLIKDITSRLNELGIKNEGDAGFNIQAQKYPILKIAICGAFYPHYFKKSQQVDMHEAFKLLGGHSPNNTVYFKNMELGHPGILYAKRVKELMDVSPEDIKVSFDSSTKIYVEFLRDMKMERNVSFENRDKTVHISDDVVFAQVYRAVKKRQLNMEHVLHVLPKEEGWRVAQSYGIKNESALSTLAFSVSDKSEIEILESTPTDITPVIICHVIAAGHFWAQRNNEQTIAGLQELEKILNCNPAKLERLYGPPIIGDILVALYNELNLFYRCKVLNLSEDFDRISAKIIFIDYGNIADVDIRDLRKLPIDEALKRPPLAFECKLYGIKASENLNSQGFWCPRANEIVSNLTQIDSFAKIYSIVDNIVRLDIYKTVDTGDHNSLKKFLLDKGYAQSCEESEVSKENHLKRLEAIENLNKGNDCFDDIQPPPLQNCYKRISLKGPYSPLETQIFNYMRDKANRTIAIEKGSVNAVLLDTEPDFPHEKLIVAAQVNQNASGNLSLRNTTIMPSLPGFPMLMALIFCPTMEPKALADGSRFGNILCGLGTYEEDRPAYAEHDVFITLDTELTNDDIEQVNEIRFRMNSIIEHMENKYNHMPSNLDIRKSQEELHNYLAKLINKPRLAVPQNWVKGAEIWKRHAFMGRTMQPGGEANATGKIWPLHWSMLLKEDVCTSEDIKRNLEELKDYAQMTMPLTEATCMACKIKFQSVSEIRIHLVSKDHVDRVKMLL